MSKPNNQTQKAQDLLKQHQSNKDKAGVKEFKHPMRVMQALPEGTPEEVKQAALLHDIVEDTDLTLKDLKKMGFSDLTLEIIDTLSKSKKFKAGDKEKDLSKEVLSKNKASEKKYTKIINKRSARNEDYVDSIINHENREVSLWSAMIKLVDYSDNMSETRLARYSDIKKDIKVDGAKNAAEKLLNFVKENKNEYKDLGVKKFGSWLTKMETTINNHLSKQGGGRY